MARGRVVLGHFFFFMSDHTHHIHEYAMSFYCNFFFVYAVIKWSREMEDGLS